MPWSRPPLTQLRTQVLQSINAAQITDQNGNVLIMLLQRAVLRVLANATAGMSYEHYGYLDWIALQAVPWTATGEFLDGWANLKGVFREAATSTTASTTFTGTATIPDGTGIARSDGLVYAVTGSMVSGGNVVVTMTCSTAGSVGNFDAGTQFVLQTSVPGVLPTSTASSQTTAGTDTELDDSLRTRMLAAYAAPPQGGDRQDYIEWALAVPGVTRAWVNPNGLGAGTVVVFFMMDDAESAFNGFPQGSNGVAANEPRGTPATGDQLTVADAILAEQPVTALVTLCAPTGTAQAFTVSDLGANNTTAMQASITAALTGMFLEYGNVGGTINPASGAAWPSIPPSAWYAALEAIPGLSQFDIPTPAAPIAVSAGQLPTLGTITFET